MTQMLERPVSPTNDRQEDDIYTVGYDRPFDHVDETGNYNEKKRWFRRRKLGKKAYQQSWSELIDADANDTDPEFDTGEIDQIQNIADRINSGELYPTDEVLENLGERALALVPLADKELPAAQVENALLRVVAINPGFESEADAAVGKIYDDRPGITPVWNKMIHDTVHRTAQVAANPDDFIDLETVDEQTPAVDRILEKANDLVTARRITQAVQQKEWAEEEKQEKISA